MDRCYVHKRLDNFIIILSFNACLDSDLVRSLVNANPMICVRQLLEKWRISSWIIFMLCRLCRLNSLVSSTVFTHTADLVIVAVLNCTPCLTVILVIVVLTKGICASSIHPFFLITEWLLELHSALPSLIVFIVRGSHLLKWGGSWFSVHLIKFTYDTHHLAGVPTLLSFFWPWESSLLFLFNTPQYNFAVSSSYPD